MTHLSADDDYLDRYHFEHDPFLGRGPSFKFFAAKRRTVLVELHHLARYSKLMLVVTGPQGSGKTVLRQALVASAKEPIKNVVIIAPAKADAAAMLQQISTALGLFDSKISDVLQHIEQLLITGQEIYVIVDNAENLDESALLLLQRIAQGVNDASARVFIFSDSSINPLLEKVADNIDLHHVIALQPWGQGDVVEYLDQRLQAAGQELDLFTEQQLTDIYLQSQGWPGQVNLAAKALLLEQVRSKSTVKKTKLQIPYKHLAVLILLAVAILFAWFMQASKSEPSVEKGKLHRATAQSGQSGVDAESHRSKTIKLDLPLELAPELVEPEPLVQTETETETVANEDNAAEVAVEEVEAEIEIEVPVEVEDEAPVEEVESADETDEIDEEIEIEVAAEAEAETEAEVAEPIAVVRDEPVLLSPVIPVPISAPAPVSAPPVVAAKKPVRAEKATVTAAKAGLVGTVGHLQWYKQQASSRFTLQVFAARAEATARALVQEHPAQLHYFRKEHQGQALFVVTYGSFVDRAAAEAAVNSLPEKIRQDKPWPRTMLSIQQESR